MVASYSIKLEPRERQSIFVAVNCDGAPESKRVHFFKGMVSASRERKATASDTTTVETANALFNQVLCRSAADLKMLTTQTPDGRYPYAGIPWYSTTFGRDGIITAIEMLWCDPSIARGVLRRLAAHQAKRFRPVVRRRTGKDPA